MDLGALLPKRFLSTSPSMSALTFAMVSTMRRAGAHAYVRLLECLREFSPRATEGATRASGLLLRELEAFLCPHYMITRSLGHRSGDCGEEFVSADFAPYARGHSRG